MKCLPVTSVMIAVAWHPTYAHPLPDGHRFPMEKYQLLPEQLRYEGTLQDAHFFQPTPIAEELILLAHDLAWWDRLKHLQLSRQEERETGFPLSRQLVERECIIMQGTVAAALHALKHGMGLNIAGGTHHAYTYKGSGFCLLNDQAIAARYLLRQGLVRQVLIVDLDVHQGDGTAQIFQNDAAVFTFSMHGASNFPLKKQTSDLDIPLPDGTTDAAYLSILSNQLPQLLDTVQPDIVFFQSGVDVLAADQLGRLALTIDGCRKRDEVLLTACHQRQIPIVASMGGGYSKRLADIIEAHANTFRLAASLYG